eukprot:EG_transcript_34263
MPVLHQVGLPQKLDSGLAVLFQDLRVAEPTCGLEGDLPGAPGPRLMPRRGSLPVIHLSPPTAPSGVEDAGCVSNCMPLTSADAPDPTSAPSSPAAPTRGFVHSPYCFLLSATDWADPGTLGVEAPPMMDLGLRIAYTTPALGGIGPLQRRKLLHGADLFYESSLLDAWSPLPDHSPNRPIR